MPRTTDHGPPAAFICRLFIDPPAEGAWNMAVDEALLKQAADEGLASLRFYQWSEPTLSLGYFQRYADREQHAASRAAAVVRRLSGGGALLHDRELTYSLCLPASHPLARRSMELYALVHEALIETLAELGVAATLHGAPAPQKGNSEQTAEPFLCFARRTPDDVVLGAPEAAEPGSDKIVGSAQRRRRGAVLQHGAILLETSPSAPELPGLRRPGVPALPPEALIPPWSERLATRLNVQLTPAEFATSGNLQLCKELYQNHVSPTWLARR